MTSFIAPGHERWDEFVRRLEGPEGCWIRTKESGGPVWDCDGNHERASRILRAMGCSSAEIRVSLEYFERHGGYCDCEILLNVDAEQMRV